MTINELHARQAYARAEWDHLAARLRTVTPQAIGRGALISLVAVVAVWLASATWPALLPFVVGALIAYLLLPAVDTLEKFMPRPAAALLSVLAVVGVVAMVLLIVIPPMANAFVRFAVDLPTAADIDAGVANLQDQLGDLPEGSAAVVIPVVVALAEAVKDAFANASGSLDDIVRTGVRAALSAIGALLGLIVLPAWMLVLLNNKRRAQMTLQHSVAPSLRQDVMAVVGIVDRATGAYIRGYVVAGLLVGALTYAGLALSARFGGPTFGEPLALAAFAGATQLIPIVGPFLGLIPALLALVIAPDRAAAYVLIYIAARAIGGTVLGARLMERRLGVHPAVLVPGVVLIGQFGILWLLLAAPIVAIAVDLVRYFHGRLSEPAAPAGVIPNHLPKTQTAQTAGSSTVALPAIYRQPQAPPRLQRTPVAPAEQHIS